LSLSHKFVADHLSHVKRR